MVARAVASSPAQLLWGATALIASVALATIAAWEIYGSARLPLVAGVGVAIGAGATALASWQRWSWWVTGVGVFGAYVIAVVPAAVPSAMTSGDRIARGVVDGVAGIVLGWKRLLTIDLPAGEYQGVLVPFFVTIIVGSLAAVALMLAGPRRAPWAVVPMLAMVSFGAVFGPATVSGPLTPGPFTVPDGRNVAVGVAGVAVCTIWLLGHARIERARAMRAAQSQTGTARLGRTSIAFALRRQALALTLVILAVAGTLLAAPVAQAFGQRQVPRDRVEPLLLLRPQSSPLASYRSWFAGTNFDAVLFTVGGGGDTDRLRIATLDTYDGETFHVGSEDTFSRAPQKQPGELTISIGSGYRGVWVPLATAQGGAPNFLGPRAESLSDAYYTNEAANAGVVITADNASGRGLAAGDVYTVAAARSAGADLLDGAQGGDPRVSAEEYPHMAAWVEQQDVGRSGSDVAELVARLRERGYLSHAERESSATSAWTTALSSRAGYVFQGNRAGHSAVRVDELFEAMLSQERRAGANASAASLVSAVGDDEQFATAAALLARYLGFESRVVVGVRLGSTGSNFGVPPCNTICTGGNLTAWAEARAPGGQWAVLDATPQFELTPQLIQEGQSAPENPTEPKQVEPGVVEPPAVVNDTAAAASETTTTEPTWADLYLATVIAIAVAAVGGALTVTPALTIPLAKASRRRWRRRAVVPEVAMVGAWHELIDTYVDHGARVPVGLTRAELADVLERPAASAVSSAVDRAVFAEQPPAREASEAVWRIVDDERRAVASSVPWPRRLKAWISLASIRRAVRGEATGAAVRRSRWR